MKKELRIQTEHIMHSYLY